METKYLDNIIYYSLLILLLLIPIIYFPNQSEPTTFSRHFILIVFVNIMLVIWLIKYMLFNKLELKKSPLNFFIVIYLFLTIISIFQSINKYESLFYISQLFSLVLLYFIILNNIERIKINNILKIVLFAGFITSVIGIFQFFEIGFLWIPSAAMPSSTFINRNVASMYLALAIPLSLIVFFITKRLLNEIIYAIMISVQLFYLICTRTRAAWISLLSAFVLCFIIVLIKNLIRNNFLNIVKRVVLNRKSYIIMITGTLLVISVLKVKSTPNIWFKQSISQTIDSFTNLEDPGRKNRIILWNNTEKLIKKNWLLGVGVGNWKFSYPLYAGINNSLTLNLRTPHNDYLWTFSELGILGFLFYLLMIFYAIYISVKIYLQSEEDNNRIVSIFFLFAILSFFINSIFSFPKDRISSSILFFISLAFISIVFNNYRKKGRIINGKKYFMVGSLFFVYSIFFLIVSYKYLLLDYHYKNAIEYYNNNQWENVINEAKKSEKYGNFYHKMHSFKGLAYLRQGKYEDTIKSFKEYLLYDPNYINILLSLGYVYEGMGLNERVIESFSKLLKIKPDLINVRNRLGKAYINAGFYDKSIEEYKKNLTFSKDSVEILSNMGVAYLLKNDFENAIKQFNKVISIDSNSVETLNNLGFIYLSKSEFDKAIKLFNKTIEINPNYVIAYNNLSKVYINQNKYNEAKEVLQKVLEIDSQYEDAYNNLIYVHKMLGIKNKEKEQ